jgi:hypothetical protein
VLIWVLLWLSTSAGREVEIGAARWVGVPLLIVGLTGLLCCVWEFGRVSKRTLAPVD